MRPLAAALLAAEGHRIVLEANPAGEVSLTAQRWRQGDRCVEVVGFVHLVDAVTEEGLVAGVETALAQVRGMSLTPAAVTT